MSAPEACERHGWDASTYDRVAAPQEEWGRALIERLAPVDGETVLDAGCGSGRVTRLLVERLPNGRVIGVDSSPAMIEAARAALGDEVELHVADLPGLRLAERVDAVFSSAVFHWVLDHDALFRSLHRALRPGGRLVAQCGGAGNVAGFLALVERVAHEQPFAEHLSGFSGNWYFSTISAAEQALRAAGFAEVSCWESEAVQRLAEPHDFLRSVCLGPHLARLPSGLHARFVDAVAQAATEAATGAPAGPETEQVVTLDYVRLNIDARRP